MMTPLAKLTRGRMLAKAKPQAKPRTFQDALEGLRQKYHLPEPLPPKPKYRTLDQPEEKGPLTVVDLHAVRAAGVYAIVDEEGEKVYIGQSKHIGKRLGQHLNEKYVHHPVPNEEQFEFHILAYVDDDEERIILERELIKKYRPKYNSLNTPYAHRTDLKKNVYKVRKLNNEHPNRPRIEDYDHRLEDELRAMAGKPTRGDWYD
jgi:hypothetical protein